LADVLPFPPQPPDSAARLQALEIRRSFIVEAPAGSGKTGLLIQRFLTLLADDSVTTPEQVLAITFTIKATAEMRDRVLQHLEAARAGTTTSSDFDRQTRTLALAVLARDRQLEWSLLDQPNRLNIRTIDSVCGEIARTLPILSGSGGRLAPIEDASALHHEAARRTLLLLGGGDAAFDTALRDLLFHRDGNLADCESLLAEMLRLRDQWGELIPLTQQQLDDAYLDAEVLPRLQRAVEHALCEELEQLEQTFPPLMLAELAALAAEFAGEADTASPLAVWAGRSSPPEAVAADLDHWLALIHMAVTPTTSGWRRRFTARDVGVALDRGQKARLSALVDRLSGRNDLREALCRVRDLPPAQFPANQWALIKSLFRILNRALVELQHVFASHNQCDFTEFSLLARHALDQDSGAEDLASALGARLQHLLIDEMQDTSAGQYEILRLLTQSWDGHSQTVFLVGDPRQSIYLFRQARVELFLRALHITRLGELPLTHLRLTANFRSQGNLVAAFNHHFERIFPPSDALPYSDADAILPASPHAADIRWHVAPIPRAPSDDSSAEPSAAQLKKAQRVQHAQEIAAIAQGWFDRSLPATRKTVQDEHGHPVPEPWRIAVLVRSRTHLTEIVAALQAKRIAYRAVDIDPLSERQEILDLTALTCALLHPADRVAGLAVLRAPWCGLSLADLHTLTGADDPTLKHHSIQRLMDERGHLLADEACQRLAHVWHVLRSAMASRARLTTAQLVERAWRTLGGDAWLRPDELANARRFFQLLDQIEADGPRIDTAQLVGRLEGLFAEPQIVPKASPCVELLTIHKAKGLEWDVVIVPALERQPNINNARLLTWSVLEDTLANPSDVARAHILLAPIAARGENIDRLTRWLNTLHQARETAETKRLFYVACTRARQELHLFASPATKANGDPSVHSRSLLKAAWPAAEPHFIAIAHVEDGLEIAAAGSAITSIDAPSKAFINSGYRSFANVSHDVSTASTLPAIQRLPATFDPSARLDASRAHILSYGEPDATAPSEALFSRPEGSFAARSFGNAVHASLQILAGRMATGEPPAQLLATLPAWLPRISALLRADGLPQATIERLAHETLTALQRVLRDPDGLWLLAPHPGAASEFALTTWAASPRDAAQTAPQPASVRADRIFLDGAEPHAPGDTTLWIVDYKTSAHSPAGIAQFLHDQRAAYAPQLETYARLLAPTQSRSADQVRLALYFPAIPHLEWWPAVSAPTP
jgi:ATP-dependent exoDNAse (exonuclease V) beta subunit